MPRLRPQCLSVRDGVWLTNLLAPEALERIAIVRCRFFLTSRLNGHLAITGPIYIATALGYVSTRSGLFVRAADMRVFGQFVIKLALPALLFNALA